MNDLKDEQYMLRALELAAKGAGFVSPNPMVGAVVVKNDQIVGQGYHQKVGGAHAEVNALNMAGDRAEGATLYVTLEPCNHHGRTPPCTEKVIGSGIKRVVTAMLDPDPTVTGGGNARLASQGIQVENGVCEAQARKLIEHFIKFKTTGLPFVVLKMAATLDGRIATRTGDARWVTGEAARASVHRMRHAMDAIMVGIGTVMADDPQLTARLEGDAGKDPARIILDTRLRLKESAQMLNQASPAATYVACAPDADKENKQRLTDAGAHILETPLKDGCIDLTALMKQLGTMTISSLLIEGGAQVSACALNEDIVDKLMLFYAPKLLVSDQAIPMFRGAGPELMKNALDVKRVDVSKIGDDILIEGYRH